MSTAKSSAKPEVRFNVRIPPDLHQRIVARAATAKQSMNTFIVEMLTRALDSSEENWMENAKGEMLRMLEEESMLEERAADLRKRRLKILLAWAEREGDREAAEAILKDLSESLSDKVEEPAHVQYRWLYPIDWQAMRGRKPKK